MKKDIFLAAFLFIVFLFGSGYMLFCENQSFKVENSSLLLKNIETMAIGEDGTDGGERDPDEIQCVFKGSLDCPKSQVKVKYLIKTRHEF